MFRVQLSDEAKRFYVEAERSLARKLARCFLRLEQEPHRSSNIKPLKGKWKGYYRFRVGDHRVVYQVDDDAQVVTVATIAHRREAYR
ncbi:MAG: type II toxin-antitoxin system RelE/ParE family toxin [Phycisphaerae bacterium]|nr:type II toxin-antitoxin system RelE/ParE family toxin [Phycisphaerae bacterium]